MARGININLFLIDGDVNRRIKCSLANWTGVAYKIPRTELDKCKDRDDLKQSGVYFLFGISDQTEKPVVYIGQADTRKNGEGILYRLQEHKRNPDKDYWTEAIVFTTSNNSLGATEISYLENRFYNLAIAAKRYDVKNIQDPKSGNVTEEKESELEEFIDKAKLIMGTLGQKVFIPFVQAESSDDTAQNETAEGISDMKLFLSRKIKEFNFTVNAQGKQTPEGFVVLAGSAISPKEDDTISSKAHKKRKNAIVDENNILQEDMLCPTPSCAAQFVIGKSDNGWTAWKTKDKKTLHDLEEKES